MSNVTDFQKALEVGRPPNVKELFPKSCALIVSGKVIYQAVQENNAIIMAANARSKVVLWASLRAAQRANSAIIVEIAKSECNYCAIDFYNIASIVNDYCNGQDITIPIVVHADHYAIKNDADIEQAKIDIPAMIAAGLTSIAVDASHLSDDDNLLANIELASLIPDWAGYETEVGEIKGKDGLSTVEEALFLIRGLNAYGIFPDLIALNNGTTHGLEASSGGINVDLTAEIHAALASYGVSGAQHGTSGNSFERLREIKEQTSTRKANVATALQNISWGVEVDEFGNAVLDADGNFIKIKDEGVTDRVWAAMVAYANEKGWKGNDYKKLNKPFENTILAQPQEIIDRMIKRVEDFVYDMMVNVFGSANTAVLVEEVLIEDGSYDLGPSGAQIEDPAEWTPEKIVEKAAALDSDKGPDGNFED